MLLYLFILTSDINTTDRCKYICDYFWNKKYICSKNIIEGKEKINKEGEYLCIAANNKYYNKHIKPYCDEYYKENY